LRDLDAWVARGIQPPASSNYRIDSSDQVQLAPNAFARNGVQPVVGLFADARGAFPSSSRIDVRAGQTLNFLTVAQVPLGGGCIVKAEFDPEGSGTFPDSMPIHHAGPVEILGDSFTYTSPGTHFPVVRITSNANCDPNAAYALIQNLASARVVVH
jgi:hypothetical protein